MKRFQFFLYSKCWSSLFVLDPFLFDSRLCLAFHLTYLSVKVHCLFLFSLIEHEIVITSKNWQGFFCAHLAASFIFVEIIFINDSFLSIHLKKKICTCIYDNFHIVLFIWSYRKKIECIMPCVSWFIKLILCRESRWYRVL